MSRREIEKIELPAIPAKTSNERIARDEYNSMKTEVNNKKIITRCSSRREIVPSSEESRGRDGWGCSVGGFEIEGIALRLRLFYILDICINCCFKESNDRIFCHN
ncbi:hypothetical protein CDAR_600921 [Caerostris darwini]|uniref:Uncharacterized protein n=1 Tax=Caerostris darwini TaxID=1538125 RepID=A0AAV4TVX4_9ARAC|nr:hypothetical protein CDAR_600921 [Caerostris darwini]